LIPKIKVGQNSFACLNDCNQESIYIPTTITPHDLSTYPPIDRVLCCAHESARASPNYYDMVVLDKAFSSTSETRRGGQHQLSADDDATQRARIALLEHFTSQMQGYKNLVLTLFIGFFGGVASLAVLQLPRPLVLYLLSLGGGALVSTIVGLLSFILFDAILVLLPELFSYLKA
jgi:hypothetical protein